MNFCSSDYPRRLQRISPIGKAKMKTIKITGLLILGFILTWFPYQLNCLWYYTNRSLFDKIGRNFQLLLWNFASMANVMNPFLYAMFDYGPDIGDIVGCRWKQSFINCFVSLNGVFVHPRKITSGGRNNNINDDADEDTAENNKIKVKTVVLPRYVQHNV